MDRWNGPPKNEYKNLAASDEQKSRFTEEKRRALGGWEQSKPYHSKVRLIYYAKLTCVTIVTVRLALASPGVGGHFNHFLPLSKASISATKNRRNEGRLEKFVLVR